MDGKDGIMMCKFKAIIGVIFKNKLPKKTPKNQI